MQLTVCPTNSYSTFNKGKLDGLKSQSDQKELRMNDDQKKSSDNNDNDDKSVGSGDASDNSNQDDDSNDSSRKTSNDGQNDDNKDKTSDSSDDKSKGFDRRFTQIKGETQEEYIKGLEDAYLNSSNEAIRLNRELKDGKKDDSKDGSGSNKKSDKKDDSTGDPFVDEMVRERKAAMNTDFDNFVGNHNELVNDKALREELMDAVETVREFARKKGKSKTMQATLNEAWILMGRQVSDAQDKVNNAIKNVAGTTRTQSKRKDASMDGEISKDTLNMAKKWGISEKQIKDAKTYAKENYNS